MNETSNPVRVSEHELSELRALIERRSGMCFDASRDRFFSARVGEYVAARGLAHGSELLRLVRSSNVEYEAVLQGLLTQETSFYRYPDAFDAFARRVLPELNSKKFWSNPRTLRIWSAGCATGEEPFSIAIAIAEALQHSEAWDIEILATDVSREALRTAARGVYTGRTLGNLSPGQIKAHFNNGSQAYEVKPRLRQMVKFAPMNLAEPIYMGRFDCIFCMNVLIYFSAERRAQLITRFHECLEPGGYLFLGHAETVAQAPVKFGTIIAGDSRVYQKPLESPILRAAASASGEANA